MPKNHTKYKKQKSNSTWIYGVHPVVAACRNRNRNIAQIVVLEHIWQEIKTKLGTDNEKKLCNSGCKIIFAKDEKEITERISHGCSLEIESKICHQGIVAEVTYLSQPTLEDIVLNQTKNNHNPLNLSNQPKTKD